MTAVSIVMPSYNKASFIGEAMASVMEQTFKDWELIIVDDASTDQTRDVLKDFEGDSRISVVCLDRQQGANYCRNKGLELSTAETVLFFDADDVLDPSCLAQRMQKIGEAPECDFLVFPAQQFVGDPSNVVNELPAFVPGDPLKEFLAINHSWQTSQLIWKKSFLQRLGGFDVTFDRFQDIELNTRALFSNPVYRMEQGKADVYVRVSRDRMTMSHYELCNKTAVSILKFCIKFQDDAIRRFRKPVYLKSIHYTVNVIDSYLKNKAITLQEYTALTDHLMKNKALRKWNWFTKRLISNQIKSIKNN